MLDTRNILLDSDFPPIRRDRADTLQVNLGYVCNQSCQHCHVNAGPNRRESMSSETIEEILQLLADWPTMQALDLTGGAPELNPHFRHLVRSARALGLRVIDRCNLTVLERPEQQGLAEFLATQGVEVVASMPCYLEENVDRQRGDGVFADSIRALQRLNRLGYGTTANGLQLNLVYNPAGASLPGDQQALQRDYQRHLLERYGIRFNRLFSLANMPINRFGSMLLSKGLLQGYLEDLKRAFCADNLATLMCRNLLSIDWQGYVYDCDFNQMLQLPTGLSDEARLHLRDLRRFDVTDAAIATGQHCYACTAGQGSSCGGALSP
jgi:radical SAM/Cys-rich protein